MLDKGTPTRRRSRTTLVVLMLVVLAPGAWAQIEYETLHKFHLRGYGGNEPRSALTFDQTGNLYGTTIGGGVNGGGTVFKLTPNKDGSWSESVLYSFCGLAYCADGWLPFAGLVFDHAGSLYGTTLAGGTLGSASGYGTVFKLTPNKDGTWSESVLYSFCDCGDGSAPYAGVIFDQAGNLYGTTAGGGFSDFGATVFKLEPNRDGSWGESVLYTFCSLSNCRDGSQPEAGLTFDRAGNLYGTTEFGGPYGAGVVFKLTQNPDGRWKEEVVFPSFGSASGLIFDQAGDLYGAAGYPGIVFELMPTAYGRWKEKVLHRFTGGKDGGLPMGVILDSAGNVYGTAFFGGSPICKPYGCGVVFKLAPNSKGEWKETVLHDFFDDPGSNPAAALIFDAAGNLYGTTYGNTSGPNVGSVFEITP